MQVFVTQELTLRSFLTDKYIQDSNYFSGLCGKPVMRNNRALTLGCVIVPMVAMAMIGAASANKGDLKVSVPRSAPLLQGRTLDLRFAAFAQGIWVSEQASCPKDAIDQAMPGSTVAIYRGLLETPNRICQVYGAEKQGKKSQRAAISCLQDNGVEAIELVTVSPSGTEGLSVQVGERSPERYRFCEPIIPLLKSAQRD